MQGLGASWCKRLISHLSSLWAGHPFDTELDGIDRKLCSLTGQCGFVIATVDEVTVAATGGKYSVTKLPSRLVGGGLRACRRRRPFEDRKNATALPVLLMGVVSLPELIIATICRIN